MYEEDSWEEQIPSAEKESEPDLVVPAKDPEKRGSRFSRKPPAAADADAVEVPRKKGIPKWQYGVLGGMIVVVGGAFVMLQLIHPDAAPVYSATAAHRGPASTDRGASPSRAGNASSMGGSSPTPSMGGTAPGSGFSTLNDLSGSTPSTTAATATPSSGAAQAPSVAESAAPASAASSAVATASSVPVEVQPSPGLGLSSGTAASSGTTATVNPQVVQLLREIRHTKDQIARLKQELQAEKQVTASSANASPRVITRTIVRYVHVPVAAPQTQPRPAAQAIPGWSVVGGNGHMAILAGPSGQERSVRVGDTLPNGAVVQRIGLGSVTTSDGVIR